MILKHPVANRKCLSFARCARPDCYLTYVSRTLWQEKNPKEHISPYIAYQNHFQSFFFVFNAIII